MTKNYICFTTIPSRFSNISRIVRHITMTYKNKFDKIKVYIPKKYKRFPQRYTIPNNLKNIHNLEIVICEQDSGPATKFIGPLLDKSIDLQDNIHIMDDDNLKDKHWIDTSKFYIQKYPGCIIQLKVADYLNKKIDLKINQIHGVSGFSFKKEVLYNNNFFQFINKLPKSFLYIDNHILTYYCYLQNIKIINTHKLIHRIYLKETDNLLLKNNNININNIKSQANQYLKNKYRLNLNLNVMV